MILDTSAYVTGKMDMATVLAIRLAHTPVSASGGERFVQDGRPAVGSTHSGAPEGQPFRSTGRHWDTDPTLQHNPARYADPKVGSWIKEKPGD